MNEIKYIGKPCRIILHRGMRRKWEKSIEMYFRETSYALEIAC
jgi:hypothetical protein